MKKVSEIGKAMSELQAKDSVLDDYAQAKVADKPETVIANYWNNTSTSILKCII